MRARPYPEALRRAILAHNIPILREALPAYARQIEKAIDRGDAVSVNHRVAGLLASYFDILFAFNRVFHPGEKRQLAYAGSLCPRHPMGMADDVALVLAHAGAADPALLPHLTRLLDRLDDLLAE